MVRIAKKAKKSKKVSRKDLKEDDKFIQTAHQSIDILDKYKKELIGSVAAILLLATGFYGFSHVRGQNNRTASAELGKALKIYGAEVTKTEKKEDPLDDSKTYKTEKEKYTAAAKAFEKILKNHASSKPAPFVHLYLANSYFQLQDYKKAKKHYEVFLAKTWDKDPLYYLGVNGLSQTLTALKSADKGVSQLSKFSKKGAKPFRTFALMGLAQHYEKKGDLKLARKFYGEISKDDKSPLKKDAKKRLERLP